MVSVSIVTYNSADVIGRLLKSIEEQTKGTEFSVFVVDNGSTDGTAAVVKEQFPDVTVIEQDNRGFGGGHNAVLDRLTSDYHAIINPDITLSEDVLSELAAYMDENPDVAITCPLIKNEDGTVQDVPRKNPNYRYVLSGKLQKYSRYFRKKRMEYTMSDADVSAPIDVEFCTGCFMFVRTDVFQKLGGFDEQFFLYCEDADLTRRARKLGKATCMPLAVATHAWERASYHNPKLFRMHLHSLRLYFRKWRKEKDV